MLFDLWNEVAPLISDSLELVGSYFPELSSISIPFLVFLFCFVVICAFAWRTTFIPELPEVPRPPYVIQISSTPTLNNNGEHNTLADVRLLSSGVDVDNLRRSFPTLLVRERGGVVRSGARLSRTGGGDSNSSQNQGGGTTGNSRTSQIRTHVRVHQVRQQLPNQVQPNPSAGQENQNGSAETTGTALLHGLLRPGAVIRPLIQRATAAGSNHVQNLIVYHRVNVYHHHHHHHHSENGQISSDSPPELSSSSPSQDQPSLISVDQNLTSCPSSSNSTNEPVPERPADPQSNRSSRSHSVDSSTQYEYVEANAEESASETYANLIDNPNSVNVLLGGVDSDGDDASLNQSIQVDESSSSRESSNIVGNDNQSQVEGGLRLRRTVAFSDIRSGGGDGNTEEPTTSEPETGKDGAMDKSQTDEVEAPNPGAAPLPADIEINDIRFTIKFLNDTQMDVTTGFEEKLLDFKRRHFATELAENKKIRLIFNGRVLEDDASTLRESGIFDQCVVHCLIVSRPTPPPPSGGPASNSGGNTGRSRRANTGILRGGPEPGVFFVGFVGVFLIFLWFICFHFGQHLFTQSAVVSLTVLTAIFLVGLVAFYLPVHPVNAA